MDIPSWLVIPDMHLNIGSVHITTGVGQVVGSDPSRIFLAIIFEQALTGNVKPDGYPSGLLGFKILSTTNYIEFDFVTHPGLVNLGWTATISAPGDVGFISIAYKPEEKWREYAAKQRSAQSSVRTALPGHKSPY